MGVLKRGRSKLPFWFFMCILAVVLGICSYALATADVGSRIAYPDPVTDICFYTYDNDDVIDSVLDLYELGPEGRIYFIMPESIPDSYAFCFRMRHAYIDVSSGGRLLYSTPYAEGVLYTDSIGFDLACAPLDGVSAGDRVYIDYRLAYSKSGVGLDLIAIMKPDEYMVDAAGENLGSVFLCSVYVSIGAVLVALGLATLRVTKKDYTMFWLGALALTVAAYCLLETKFLQVFIEDARFVHLAVMLSMYLIPIPAAAYVDSLLGNRPFWLVPAFSIIVFGGFVTAVVMNNAGTKDYHGNLLISQCLVLIAIGIMAVGIASYIIRRIKSDRKITVYTAFMIIGALAIMASGAWAIVWYWLGHSSDPAGPVRYGFLIFLLAFAVASSERIVTAFQDGARVKLISKLAYEDGLTGLKNRTSYQEMCERIELEGIPTGVVMMDLNNLKYVNDNFGHDDGDEMLTAAANLIKFTFKDIIGATCYRIGGDEFVALVQNSDIATSCESALENMRRGYNRFNSDTDKRFKLVIAAGYSIYDPGSAEGMGRDLKAVVDEADGLMYADKKYLKSKKLLNIMF